MLSGLVTGEGLSELEVSAQSFSMIYDQHVLKIDQYVVKNIQIFSSSETRIHFYDLLSDCFSKLNLFILSDKSKFWGGASSVSFKEISDELYKLPNRDLEALKILHYNLVQTSPGEKIAEAYRPLAIFFDRMDLSKEERLNSVRFLMDIASLAREILQLKKAFVEYQPKTVAEMDQLQESLASVEATWSMHGLLERVLASIQTISQSLEQRTRPLWEVGNWLRRLGRHRRNFSQKLIIVSSKGLKEVQQSTHRLIVAMESWFNWEVICLKDNRAEQEVSDEDFADTLTSLKTSIYQRLDSFEKLIQVLRQAKLEELEGVSLYFMLILTRHEKLYRSTLNSAIAIEPSLRQVFKKLSNGIMTLKIKVSNIYQQDLERISNFPDIVQERIKYFQYQVPDVLLRGRHYELKKLTSVIKHCYLQVGLAQHERAAEVPLIRSQYTKIVVNATSLVNRFNAVNH